jgi:transcription termination factor NusB
MANLDDQSGAHTSAKVSPARACAYAVVRRVFEQDAWADRALHGEARRLRLDARDLALATRLTYGTVQRASTLDHVIETLAGRRSARLDAPVLAALRLGIFQLAFLDRVPAHAAVGEMSPYEYARRRSEALVRQQFGHQPAMSRLGGSIWDCIEYSPDRAIRLTDVQAAAAEVSCGSSDVLALLGLLSST